MIKLFVSDLDGTLLDAGKRVSARELEALTRAKEAGMELCLASGRMHSEMVQVMESIGFAAYSISQNGALMHDKQGTLLHAHRFAPQLAYQAYEIASRYEMVKLICTGNDNYITSVAEQSEKIQARMFRPFVVRADAGEALRHELPACKFSFFGDIEVLMNVKAELEASLGKQLTMYLADHDCLDVMPLHVSKGSSLLALMDKLKLDRDEVACIGDSFNDVSMLSLTRHSFAMSLAHADVRKEAAHEAASVAAAIGRVLELNKTMQTKKDAARCED